MGRPCAINRIITRPITPITRFAATRANGPPNFDLIDIFSFRRVFRTNLPSTGIECKEPSVHVRSYRGYPPCQLRATEHPLSAPRCRGGIRPSASEIQGRQRGARNRNPPNVDRGKEARQVLNRHVSNFQDLRGASPSPSGGPP